jgi:hypothetical protein
VSVNRYNRRQRRRQVRDLADQVNRLHAELLTKENLLHTSREQRGEIVERALQQIELYVDATADLVDLDEKQDLLEEPRVYDLLVSTGWRGVETVEQARKELDQEVARRSVGKTDLALLLSSIDHTAVQLYGRMPSELRDLHGSDLVEASVKVLSTEGFDRTLHEDPKWAVMRKRWVRFGWRGTDDQTFDGAFVRAVSERVAIIHDSQGDEIAESGMMLDTVLDEQLKRVRPDTRERMAQAFKERLQREYAALAQNRSVPDARVQPVDDAEARPAATPEQPPRVGNVLRTGSLATVEASRPNLALGSPVAYSDHNLMRWGRSTWELTYAVGMTDDEVWEQVAGQSSSASEDALLLFQPKWAVHAFQRLMTSHTFAAALMCSDVQRDVLVGIEKQWDAFMVLVPNGMLISDGLEVSRILVATYSFGAQMILVAVLPNGQIRTALDERPTLPDLLVSVETDMETDSQATRCLVMAKRLVAGLLLNLQHPPNFAIKKVEAKPRKKGREAEPEHRIVTIGKPLEIDCRDAVREYVERGRTGRKHGPPTVQVMVRGHYRRQVCGVGRLERKVIWIEPFWRGPEAALIQTRASKVQP